MSVPRHAFDDLPGFGVDVDVVTVKTSGGAPAGTSAFETRVEDRFLQHAVFKLVLKNVNKKRAVALARGASLVSDGTATNRRDEGNIEP